jgi:hypothetical protein
MGQCPFCRESVDADVLVNGGRCPSCLIEIPGEEAATDPGEDALARQAAETEAARRSPLPVVAAVGLALVVAGGIGWSMMSPAPEPVAVGASGADVYRKVGDAGLRKINLDDIPVEVEEPPPVERSRASKPTTVRSAPPTRNDAAKVAVADPPPLGGPAAPPPVTETAKAPEAPSQRAGIIGTGGSGGGPTLDDPLALGPGKKGPGRMEVCGAEMLSVARTNFSSLQNKAKNQCATPGKVPPDFSAKVDLTVVVLRSGRLGEVVVNVRGTDDAAFIGCVERLTRATEFPPLCEDLELAKQLKFGG